MKKFFSLLMAVLVLATSLWFSTGTASAAGSNVVFYAPGVSKQDVKIAMMFAGSEYQKVYCVLKDVETGEVVCKVPGKYAGQAVRIYFAGKVFFASVPNINIPTVEVTENPPVGTPTPLP